MARFYVIAAFNSKLTSWEMGNGITANTPAPQISEHVKERDTKELDQYSGTLLENNISFLSDACTEIEEAVEIEGSAEGIYSILKSEQQEAVHLFSYKISEMAFNYDVEYALGKSEFKAADYLNEYAHNTDSAYPTPDSISTPFLIPLLSEYINLPKDFVGGASWSDDDSVLHPEPTAGIVCITEAELLALPDRIKAQIARAIRAARNNPNDTILKRLAATAAILSEMEPGEPAAAGITPTTAPDAADATAEETPATGTGETAEAAPVKRRRLPAGFKMIKQGQKLMTDEHKDLFFRKVLKHVVNIGHHTADGKKWEYANKEKTGTNQTRDHESFIFEYNGTRYRVFCYIDTKPEFCVKRQDCTGQGHPHYFHFIG